VVFRLSKHEKPLSFLSLDSLNKHWKAHMEPNHSILGFVKYTSRELSKGRAYINKHMLSSSSLHKNKEVLTRNGGGKFGKGMCLCICINGSKHRSWTWNPASPLESGLGNWFVSCLSFCKFISRVVFESILPRSLLCHSYVQAKFNQNLLSIQPYVIVYSYHVILPCVSPKSHMYFSLS